MSVARQPDDALAPLTPLRVLLLEDSAADADLILRELRRGGYEPAARRVESCEEMLAALSDASWQVVLLDYTLEGGESWTRWRPLLIEVSIFP
jgi:DNA-binding response OmpR family regulator